MNTGFLSSGMTNREASAVHDKFFGNAGISEDTVYVDKMRGIDMRESAGEALAKSGVVQIAKATGASMDTATGGTYSAQGMLPAWVDPSIVDQTIRETPLVSLMPRIASRSIKYVYNKLTQKNKASFEIEDAAAVDQVDTYETESVDMKFLRAYGRTTGPALVGAQDYINLFAQDIRVATVAMNEALENEIINGDISSNANGFDGLIKLITSNAVDNTAGNITLAQIREDFNSAFETGGANGTGLIDLVVTDGFTHNYIKGLLLDYQRNVEQPSGMMDFGIPGAFTFDGALFIRDRFMPTTATQRRILYLDTRYWALAILLDLTFEPLAKTNDSDRFMMKWYGALVDYFEASSAQRFNLA